MSAYETYSKVRTYNNQIAPGIDAILRASVRAVVGAHETYKMVYGCLKRLNSDDVDLITADENIDAAIDLLGRAKQELNRLAK